MKHKVLIVITVVLLFHTHLNAETPQIKFEIDTQKIGLEDNAVITLTLDTKAKEIEMPQGKDYQVAYGGLSQSTQVFFSNGQIKKQTSFTYTYRIVPKKKGKLKIGQFKITIGNETYLTEEFEIQVVEGSIKGTASSQDPFSMIEQFFGQQSKPKLPNIFFRLEPDTYGVYQNQPLVINGLVFAENESLLESSFVESAPLQANQALFYDITDHMKDTLVYKTVVEGQEFYVKTIKKYVVYPVEAGPITIVPPEIIAMTGYGPIQLKARNTVVDSYKIKEQSGLSYIGNLELNINISTNLIEIGKFLEINLEMIGNGNLKVFSNPYSDLKIDGLFISAPKTKIDFLEWRNDIPYFRQTVSYNVLAQHPGSYEIPQIVISYLDSKLEPKTVKVDSIKVEVVKGSVGFIGTKKFEMKQLETNLNQVFIVNFPIVIGLLILFALMPLGAMVIGKHKMRMLNDKGYSRKFLANRRLAKFLKDSRTNLDKGMLKEFYITLQKAIFYYVTDKFGIPAGIEFGKLKQELEKRGVNQQVIADLEQVYRQCNYHGFSGNPSSAEANALFELAGKALNRL